MLEAFVADAASQLVAETADGAEIPFELVETGGRRRGRSALYCYRPLTGAFINDRRGLLSALPSYAPVARALSLQEGVEAYLRQSGQARVPGDARQRGDAALHQLLVRVFADRSEFGFDRKRFEAAYAELEHALYDGRCITIVIASLLGVALDHTTNELALGDGLSLIPGEKLPDAPAEAVWAAHGPDGTEGEDPNVLARLIVTQDRAIGAPVSMARARFRRVLTALRLFERGGYALGPLAWTRTEGGTWRPVGLGGSGRPRFVTLISAAHEDELRAFCNLVARRMPVGGELAWALARFEMGCERLAPFEALTDYLLALRALLEPEGPGSGRLAQRLAVICGQPAERAALAERTARAISLERAVIAGLAAGPDESSAARSGQAGCRADHAGPGADALVDELADHLRALLRDAICGHLDSDLRSVADELLAEAADAIEQGAVG